MTDISTLIQTAAAMARSQTVGENIVLCKAIDRLFYVDSRDVTIAPHLMINGLWEPNVTLAIAKHIKRGMHCLDVGANVGYFSILMASSGALVDAFEPNPWLTRLLAMTVEINGYQNQIAVHEKAVCEKEGIVELQVSLTHNGHSSIAHTIECPSRCIARESVELDSYSGSGPSGVFNLSKVDFIKCDVEGAEVLVWAGMQRLWADNPQMQGCFESLGTAFDRANLYEALLDNDTNWVGVINPAGVIVPIDRETAVSSTGLDMLWVRHRT